MTDYSFKDEMGVEVPDEPLNRGSPTPEEAPTSTPENGFTSSLPDFVTYETGKRDIQYYRDHSINVLDADWLAHIIKGIDGLTKGKLKNYWFFDVITGIYKAFKGGETETSADGETPENMDGMEIVDKSEIE